MTVIGVIPARYHSTRLPAKPLADILGKPMVQWVYEIALQAKLLDEVVVATDDERIAKVVEHFGGRVVMTSASHTSGTDRVAEVAARYSAGLVVNIQGDEPLLDPMMIDECVRALKDALSVGDGVGLSTVIKQVGEAGFHDPGVVKVVRDTRGRALYFSRSLIPFPRNRPETYAVFEHIGLYAYTTECLVQLSQLPPSHLEQLEGLEQLRALENRILIQTVETGYQGELISVDTPEDLERVRTLRANGVNQ